MFDHMQFQGEWRDYQARVLQELQSHLTDEKLHVVAAPGSGKTVLGLEVMRELAKPALILSPTLTIRNQWSERLFEMFVPTPDHAQDISYDLRSPANITSVTYQALHAIWKIETGIDGDRQRPAFERLIEQLKGDRGVTILVDEAHHLRREWWRALNALTDALPEASLVALTATPPYDASYTEWMRYDDLCGAIDAEISVPELVRNGDLCPHQDHIHFSLPQKSELDLLENRRRGVFSLVSAITNNAEFIGTLLNHPWISAPDIHEEAILSDPEFLSSMLIILVAGNTELPSEPLDLLGVENRTLPTLSPAWLEVFLNGFLFAYSDDFNDQEVLRKQIEQQARKAGLIENNRVKLMESRKLLKAMAGSLAKLDSIEAIARSEHTSLKDDLRMVVLTDYVRASDLPKQPEQAFNPTKLGVVPIFDHLRRAQLDDVRLAVLTGTMVIIPDCAIARLPEASTTANMPIDHIKVTALRGCPGFSQLRVESRSSQKMVRLVTHLFNLGAIQLLVGTQALLGEGWDAPTINTLVLASNVGSYMLSNQMRGRAIRIDKDVPDKVANIWHLATIEPSPNRLVPDSIVGFLSEQSDRLPQLETDMLGSDMRLLSKRFEMFEGVSNDSSDFISNGITRLDIVVDDPVEARNAAMFDIARNRVVIADKWRWSLGDPEQRSHVQKIVQSNYAPRKQSYIQTLQYLSISAVLGGVTSAAGAMRQFQSVQVFATLVMIFGGMTLLYSLPKFLQAGRLFFRNGTLERSLQQVSRVALESLSHVGLLAHPSEHYTVEVEPTIRGQRNIILHNASRAEERLFLDALTDILAPIENPRYLIIRKSWLGSLVRKDYHAVPTVLGKNKDDAMFFARRWRKHVGEVELVFTRQKEGRRKLLHARANAMSAGFHRLIDRRSQWR